MWIGKPLSHTQPPKKYADTTTTGTDTFTRLYNAASRNVCVPRPNAWCSRRTERTSLLAYGSLRVWQNKVVDAVKGLKNLSIAAVPQEVLETLATDMPRTIKWDVMISEGTLFVTDDRGQHEVQLEWLLGERG